MNDSHSPSFGNPESSRASTPNDDFRSILNHLPHQDKPPRKKRENTLEGLVGEFYPLLEEARMQRNYSYEQLAELFAEHLGRHISKDTLRKYMGRFRQQQQGTSTPNPQSTASTHRAHSPTQPNPQPKIQEPRKVKESNPAQRLPRNLTANPRDAFRTTRTQKTS
ncbi:hypothetical protein IQ235_04730 [Oscillatoriales cyanobacterium LEGE 11467]|uniref:Uncharacterized protein n=1 Tax=Zarconia navalis LEGE 11467 TaxID=1828826 RepID=A0A928VWM9_9CYAN|nr:hypothetical protein [Zarconia navalis]MBE9040097.1 hypothetical protein [Zarconia navalis LEGE 11467]